MVANSDNRSIAALLHMVVSRQQCLAAKSSFKWMQGRRRDAAAAAGGIDVHPAGLDRHFKRSL